MEGEKTFTGKVEENKTIWDKSTGYGIFSYQGTTSDVTTINEPLTIRLPCYFAVLLTQQIDRLTERLKGKNPFINKTIEDEYLGLEMAGLESLNLIEELASNKDAI